MKIQAKYMAAKGQVHNGKCYFIGMTADSGQAFNIESGGTAGDGNKIFSANAYAKTIILPKPGVECSNGLYVDNDCIVYYSLG